MHELSAAQSIMDAVLEHARRNDAARVLRVNLLKGDLCDYVDETIVWLLNMLAEQTVASGAQIEIAPAPIVFHCSECEAEFIVERDRFEARCTVCHSGNVRLSRGGELYLESIEIE